MQNSYVSSLQGLYRAILTDVTRTYPTYHHEAERDLSRIHLLLERNGIAVITMSFPEMGKHLDRCLSTGLLTSSGTMGFKPFRRGVKIPRLFKGIWLRVFHLNGVLRENPDIDAILMLRQLLYAAKKLRRECDESRTAKAVQDFFRLDQSLRLPSLSWGGDRLDLDAVRDLSLFDRLETEREPDLFDSDESGAQVRFGLLETTQRVADIISTSLGWFDPAEWRAKHGPGAVADAQLGKSSKYSFPTWPAKLDWYFPMDSFGFANASYWVDHLVSECGSHVNREDPSRLIAVPKTQKGPRLIAAEPTSHQWAQQTIKDFLTVKVRKTPIGRSIRFNDQRPNQDFAKSASTTGSHWTIDLSSASDCVSCWLVERIFRANKPLLSALHSARTRWLVNQITSEPRYHMIRKFAAMGAATTFPVQTYIYTIVCVAAMLNELGLAVTPVNIRRMSRQVRVFGDDIVVPSTVGTSVVQVLTYLGFKVNPSKTFGTGKFRESCGVECFDGHDVTPAYFLDFYDRSRPTTVATIVETSNNFYKKGFWITAEWLKSTLPLLLQQELPVVKTVGGQFGLVSFSGGDVSHLRSRWNADLQRTEYRAVCLTTKSSRKQSGTSAELLQFFTEEPNPDVLWMSGYAQRPTVNINRRWVPSDVLAA